MIYLFPHIKKDFILFGVFFFLAVEMVTLFLLESLSSYGDLWERSLGENGYMYMYD